MRTALHKAGSVVPVTWTGNQVRERLREAVDELGAVPPASNHIPLATKAATIDQWRDYAYRRGISPSDKPRARQAAFQRAVQSLCAAGLVGIWEPHAWPA